MVIALLDGVFCVAREKQGKKFAQEDAVLVIFSVFKGRERVSFRFIGRGVGHVTYSLEHEANYSSVITTLSA